MHPKLRSQQERGSRKELGYVTSKDGTQLGGKLMVLVYILRFLLGFIPWLLKDNAVVLMTLGTRT